MDNYELWVKGLHEELLEAKDEDFLRWVANYGIFPERKWADKFLLLGRLKRIMRERMANKPFGWCPLISLPMPWGCSASCRFCTGAKKALKGNPPATVNTTESLLEAIANLGFPETVSLSAEWGDPSLHPKIIDKINERIEKDWLATKYTLLTNLSRMDGIKKALPYTRVIIVQFTMSEPAHARSIMGYKKDSMFDEMYDNVKFLCEFKKQKKVFMKIQILFIVDRFTVQFVSQHYALFKDLEEISLCQYKPSHAVKKILPYLKESRRQEKLLEHSKGKVAYEWQI